MTTDVQGAQAEAAATAAAVDQAEGDLVSGRRSISAAALNKLRDGMRHAELTLQRTRTAAEEQRRSARLQGLEAIGAEVDKLAEREHTEPLEQTLRDLATAAAHFRTLAAAHDADVADLVAAASDHQAEPAAPEGPRATSSFVAVNRGTIAHRRVTVRPLGDRNQAAIGHAVNGDISRAVAEVRTAAEMPKPKRPDHLLRNERSGMLVPIYGPLSDGMQAQFKSNNPRSGELEELSDHDIDRYMRGELA
jgi:hypothetical protein